MNLKKDAYVKIVGVTGEYRYGYVSAVTEAGWHIEVCMHDEGDSKIGYDDEWERIHGNGHIDPTISLSEIEKRLIPMLAQDMNTAEVGCQMGIAEATVRAHIRTLRIKLGLENKTQLVTYCHGLQHKIEKAIK